MANYSETFLFTALPAGINGTKLRVAVLVSPRLNSDDPAEATLDKWPDVQEWPGITPNWTVTVKQGATTVTLPATEIKSEPYDDASWQQLFGKTSTALPYQPQDRSQTPIFSYPVSKVVEAAKDLHTSALRHSRGDFPAVAALQESATFQHLKTACDPDYQLLVIDAQRTGPVADASLGLADAFALAGGWHGPRPGSTTTAPTPVIDSINPNVGGNHGGLPVTLTGAHFKAGMTIQFGAKNATNVEVFDGGNSAGCKTPSGPADKTVQVRVIVEDQVSNPIDFFYYEEPK